jgi:hypothetical protein
LECGLSNAAAAAFEAGRSGIPCAFSSAFESRCSFVAKASWLGVSRCRRAISGPGMLEEGDAVDWPDPDRKSGSNLAEKAISPSDAERIPSRRSGDGAAESRVAGKRGSSIAGGAGFSFAAEGCAVADRSEKAIAARLKTGIAFAAVSGSCDTWGAGGGGREVETTAGAVTEGNAGSGSSGEVKPAEPSCCSGMAPSCLGKGSRGSTEDCPSIEPATAASLFCNSILGI